MLDRVKAHVGRHKVAYSLGTVVVIAGVAYYVGVRAGSPTYSVGPVFNNVINNDGSVNFGGHTTKMVKRLSDGAMWETVTEAAEANGAPLSLMSRHLNGHKPDVYNEVYKIVGIGTTG